MPTLRAVLAVLAAVLFTFAGLTMVLGIGRDIAQVALGLGWFSFGMAALALSLAVPRGNQG